MSRWEENIRKVIPYTPGEQPNQPDMIKLNTNENPYPPAPVEECVDHLHQIIVSEHSRVSRNAEFIADIQKQTKAFQK